MTEDMLIYPQPVEVYQDASMNSIKYKGYLMQCHGDSVTVVREDGRLENPPTRTVKIVGVIDPVS